MISFLHALTSLPPPGVGDWIAMLSLGGNAILGIPPAVRRIKRHLRSRGLRALLGSKTAVIHIPSRNVKRLRDVVAQEDFETASTLKEIFERNGIKAVIRYIDPNGAIDIQQSVANVLVCGPKNSPAVQAFFERTTGFSITRHEGRWELFDPIANAHIVSPMDQQPPLPIDLAYLGKVHMAGLSRTRSA